jgi:hypothetical protein
MAQGSSYGCMHLVGETHLLFDRQSLYLFHISYLGFHGLGREVFCGWVGGGMKLLLVWCAEVSHR